MSDQIFMVEALTQARIAGQNNEVPVGAVLVAEDKIIAQAFNQPIMLNDPTAHAEILCLRSASETLQNYRLVNTTLYVTLEPCLMCVGALVHARIARVVFGASDPKSGALGGVVDALQLDGLNHRFVVESGVHAEQCGQLLKEFFRARR